MTDFAIPCDTIARLSNVASSEFGEWFGSLRIDNGVAVVTDSKVLAAELIGGPSGIFHLMLDPALIAQCKTEAPFNSLLHVNVNEAMQYAVGKTTMGYIFPGNCMFMSTAPNDFDKWRSIVPRKPATKSRSPLWMNTERLANLGRSSPSGRLVFEQHIDASITTLVRDTLDSKWFGMWNPHTEQEQYEPAKLPDWMD